MGIDLDEMASNYAEHLRQSDESVRKSKEEKERSVEFTVKVILSEIEEVKSRDGSADSVQYPVSNTCVGDEGKILTVLENGSVVQIGKREHYDDIKARLEGMGYLVTIEEHGDGREFGKRKVGKMTVYWQNGVRKEVSVNQHNRQGEVEMKDKETVKDITSTIGYILGCVLVVLFCLFCLGWFTGCSGDNGTSAPSRICYDKELGYSDVNGKYKEYYGEWIEAACVGVRIDGDCTRYDIETTIVKKECVGGVVVGDVAYYETECGIGDSKTPCVGKLPRSLLGKVPLR